MGGGGIEIKRVHERSQYTLGMHDISLGVDSGGDIILVLYFGIPKK
jgi:hypothetical protein